MKWSYRSTLVKKHIEDENADIVGICELDCKDNQAKVFDKNINQEGKEAHEDFVSFMEKQGYDKYIVERKTGMNATAIFYKKDKFQIC